MQRLIKVIESSLSIVTTSLSAFGFTQVVAATQTQVVGYAEAFCPGSGSFPYVPPTGWTCTACTYEGVGTYGGCSYCGMVLVTLTPNSSTYYLDSSDVITPNVGGNCATVNPADQAACYADNAANTPTCTAYCSGTTYYGCNSGIATAGVIEIGQCGCTCMSSVCISGTYYPCSGGVIQTGIPDSTYCTSTATTTTNAQSADITLYAVVGGLLVVAAAVALFLGSKSSQSSPPPPSSPPPKQ